MGRFLVFRLQGPMAAWGGITVGEVRDCDPVPTKSAILGLVAGAMGLGREDVKGHQDLHQNLALGLHVEAAGVLLRDFHTVQVAGQSAMKGRPHATRRDELALPPREINTLVTTRDYRCDVRYTVALWAREGAMDLINLAQRLRKPRYVPFLGRKACPVGLPFQPCILEAATLESALAEALPGYRIREAPLTDPRPRLEESGHEHLYWEEGLPVVATPLSSRTRRDALRDRSRWTFSNRIEHHALYSGEPR